MTLKIIGTSHIAKQSVQEVENAFEEHIDILALELDDERLKTLLEKEHSKNKTTLRFRDVRTLGVKVYILARLISWAESHLGSKVGTAPGTEMLKAYKIAKIKKIPITLVDQDVRITLQRLTKLTWKEYYYFIADMMKGLLAGMHIIKQEKIVGIELLQDLDKVPREEIIEKLLLQTKQRYPTLYRTLVTERNKIIARRLSALQHEQPRAHILAVLGAGHKKEVYTLYEKYMKMEYVKRDMGREI